MKRWLAVMAVVLGIGGASAHADYLKMTYFLGLDPTPNQPANMMGRGGPFGGMPKPGGAFPGLPGGMMRPGQGPKRPLDVPADDDNRLKAEAIVEYTKPEPVMIMDKDQKTLVQFLRVHHKWGVTSLPDKNNDKVVKWEEEPAEGLKVPSVKRRFFTKEAQFFPVGKPKTPEKLVQLADWALTHGLLDEFSREPAPQVGPGIMEELIKIDPKHPVALAFKKVKENLKKSLPNDQSAANAWKDRLGISFKIESRDHYYLLYNTTNRFSGLAKSRLDRLEENLKGIYYWFSLRGTVLPPLSKKLVAVLVSQPSDFQDVAKQFDSLSMGEDGFYARRENLVVFSGRPIDPAYDALEKITKPFQQDFQEYLKPKGVVGEKGAVQRVHNQDAALLLTALEEKSELASVSHEGSVQLITTTGLLPHNVMVPDWILSGLGSYFETPREAWWPGIGAPHWNYHVKFKVWGDNKKLEASEVGLRNVVTDRYFRLAYETQDKKALEKAKAMAWSLIYYCMAKSAEPGNDGNRYLNMKRLFDELSSLPRDLEFDEETYLQCFARSFDLMDGKNPTKIDALKFKTFARDWYDFVDAVPLGVDSVKQAAVKQAGAKKQKKPG